MHSQRTKPGAITLSSATAPWHDGQMFGSLGVDYQKAVCLAGDGRWVEAEALLRCVVREVVFSSNAVVSEVSVRFRYGRHMDASSDQCRGK